MDYEWVRVTCFSGREIERRFLGTESRGWCFALHIYPGAGIKTIEDWEERLKIPGSMVFNDSGEVLTAEQILHTIKGRGRYVPLKHHALDRYVVAHGEGAWDYVYVP